MNTVKTLFLDIECSGLDANFGNVLTVGRKWASEKHVRVDTILQHQGKNLIDDSKLLEAVRGDLEEADLIVHHFGDFYDIPFLQTRAAIHKIPHFAIGQTFDTWRVAKKKMRFSSNRLDAILRALGCPFEKSAVDPRHWCLAKIGDKKSMKYIVDHNIADVLVLEWVYERIRPLAHFHPRLFSGPSVCPQCGSPARSKGRVLAMSRWYQKLRCRKCYHTFRGHVIPSPSDGLTA